VKSASYFQYPFSL